MVVSHESSILHPDVLIIGGGVIGVCTAYYLTAAGLAVTLIEKDRLCTGSSYGNAGMIVPSHALPLATPEAIRQGLRWLLDKESPFYIKPRLSLELLQWLWHFFRAATPAAVERAIPIFLELSRISGALFGQLAAEPGLDFGYQQRGGLFLYTSAHGLEKGKHEAALMRGLGVETEILDGEEVRRLEAGVLPAVIGGIYYPGDAHLIPDQFVHGLGRLVAQRGVQLQTGTEVLSFVTQGERIHQVVTTRGSYTPGQVVLAAGAWSPWVARELGLRLPVQPAKGYSITVRRPPHSPQIPLHLSEGKVAVTPLGDHLRFAGTLELAGLDLTINRRRVDAIRRTVTRYLPLQPDRELVEIWRGLRPLTPDTLPMVGRSRRYPNLLVGTGHGMLGVSLGPVTGQLLAQLATGATPVVELAPLRIERFGR